MFTRFLWTIAAIVLGFGVGMILATLAVGAPHAVPGILEKAPEQVRNDVSLAIFLATPVVFVVLLWTWFIRQDRADRRGPTAPFSDALTAISPEQLAARFQQKPTEELLAILRTRGQSLYPARTYDLVAEVLKNRGVTG